MSVKVVPICHDCPGRDKCPVSEEEKQRRVFCREDLYDKYHVKENSDGGNVNPDQKC